MKKLSMLIAAAVAGSTAIAQTVTPQLFFENFGVMGNESDYPDSNWVTYGNGATPGCESDEENYMQIYFGDGKEAPYFVLMQYDDGFGAFSCTNFVPTTEADQWLVTPEIEIPYDDVSLYFRTLFYQNLGYWGRGSCPIEVLVSENGTDKSSFSTVPVYKATVQPPGGSKTLGTTDYVVPMSGYAGKKVHLAFVQRGTNVGMFGFTNIGVSQYYCKFDTTNTNETAVVGEPVTISVNTALKTPVACDGINTRLVVNGVQVGEKYYPKKLGTSSTQLQYVDIKYQNIVDQTAESTAWTLYVTPEFEGAVESSISGVIGAPVTTYPNNCVVEEITATGCGYCPAGTASMEYYGNTYQGQLGRGKFIGIAIHGNMNYLDPMSVGVESYRSFAANKCGSTSLPAVNFNRNTIGQQPWYNENVRNAVMETSYTKAEITGVVAPEVADPELVENYIGRNMRVNFNVYTAYNAASRNINAAVVLVENDVQGYNSGYSQENYLYRASQADLTNNYGSFLLPYTKEYLPGGKYGYSMISFEKIQYQHVARGIWPEYEGTPLEDGEWEADKPRQFHIDFTLPENMLNFNNTEVIVIVTDGNNNGKIIASDIFPAANYEYSAVDQVIGENNLNVVKNGETIIVTGNNGQNVDIYNVDGTNLGHYTIDNNVVTVDGSAFNGVVIVKVGNVAKKLLF